MIIIPNLEDPEDEWEVEKVLDEKYIKDIVYYLVKWIGWPLEYNSYELVAYLTNAPQAIVSFERKRKRKADKANEKAGKARRKRARY